jgi:hypothetical protein
MSFYVFSNSYTQYKPELHSLLTSALPYGLRLHGTAWEGVAELGQWALGPLPRYELASAYASATAGVCVCFVCFVCFVC